MSNTNTSTPIALVDYAGYDPQSKSKLFRVYSAGGSFSTLPPHQQRDIFREAPAMLANLKALMRACESFMDEHTPDDDPLRVAYREALETIDRAERLA